MKLKVHNDYLGHDTRKHEMMIFLLVNALDEFEKEYKKTRNGNKNERGRGEGGIVERQKIEISEYLR